MDPVEEWTAAQGRVVALVEGLDEEATGRTVPTTPAWTVRELLSHMIGLDADVVAGTVADDHDPTWTQQQVDARADRTVPDLLQEWAGLTEPVTAWMRAHSPDPLGDVVIHEQDLRGALGAPGARDTEGLAAVREQVAGRFAEAVADLPPLALLGGSWTFATKGEPAGAGVALEGSDFELFRALLARRSEAQLRRMTTRGDVGPYLSALGAMGALPTEDVLE